MLKVKNIRSVTDFARNTKSHIRRLQKTKEPEVLTVNGRAAVVVVDANVFQRLLDQLDYQDSVRILRERLANFEQEGIKGRPMREVIEELATKTDVELQHR